MDRATLPSVSSQGNSTGQPDVQQGVFTHMQPWPFLSKLLDDEHNCHKELPGKLEPFQAKGKSLAFLQPPATAAQEILL